MHMPRGLVAEEAKRHGGIGKMIAWRLAAGLITLLAMTLMLAIGAGVTCLLQH